MAKICQKLYFYNNYNCKDYVLLAIGAFFVIVAMCYAVLLGIALVDEKNIKSKFKKCIVATIIGAIFLVIPITNIEDYDARMLNKISPKATLVQVRDGNERLYFENIKQKKSEITGKPLFTVTRKLEFLGSTIDKVEIGKTTVTITRNAQITKVNARKAIKEHLTDSF